MANSKSIKLQLENMIGTLIITLISELFIDRFAKNVNKDHRLLISTSFKIDIPIRTSDFVEIIQSELESTILKDDYFSFWKSIHKYVSISAFDILHTHDKFESIKSQVPFKFLTHIKNAAINNNIFLLNKTNLPETIAWREKKLTIRRNGKPCFFSFMAVGDLTVLLNDIYRLI
jgi:hypothetical protein